MLIVDDACGRYVLKATPQQLAEHYNLANPPKDIRPNYNVAPGQTLPVVTAGKGHWQLEPMRWGLVPCIPTTTKDWKFLRLAPRSMPFATMTQNSFCRLTVCSLSWCKLGKDGLIVVVGYSD
jgi:putative SOS response-associated peptidase YedK